MQGLGALQTSEMFDALPRWQKFAYNLDLSQLDELAIEPVEESPDGAIYVVKTPEDLPGDFVVVDMSNVDVDTPHFHTDGEIEIHLPLTGYAEMSLGRTAVDFLTPGIIKPVAPMTPHFIIPSSEYVTGILSLPNYNPDRQVEVGLAAPPQDFNADLYSRLKALP